MPRLAAGFLAATVVGLFFAAQIRVCSLATGHPTTWPQALYWALGDWYEWAMLAPVYFHLARRFRFDRNHWAASLAVHLVCGLALAVVHAAMCASLAQLQAWHQGASTTFAHELRLLVTRRLHYNLAVGALIVAGWHVWTLRRESADRAAQTAELSAQLAEARLQALRLQLNPHFLFNTLNSISAMMLKDVSTANLMLAGLGDFLRRTLETAHEPQIPLRREIDFARQYLEIERMRFGSRLSVHFSVDPAVLDAPVPNLLLQPLVENAIRHGVEHTSREARIAFSAREEGGFLRLDLTNSGGLEQGAGPVAASADGVGLGNTRQRLRQLYGAAHDFIFERGTGGVATVLIRIPLRAAGFAST